VLAGKVDAAGRARIQAFDRGEVTGLVVRVGALEQRQLRPVLQVRQHIVATADTARQHGAAGIDAVEVEHADG
jgi:hypothetical protein